MKRMACSLTIPQVRARSKTETRRSQWTWRSLEPGDRLALIEKGMGLKKGDRQVVLATVEVVSNDLVRLRDITPAEVAAEGFPAMTVDEFIEFWLDSHDLFFGSLMDLDHRRRKPVTRDLMVRRIAWSYLE